LKYLSVFIVLLFFAMVSCGVFATTPTITPNRYSKIEENTTPLSDDEAQKKAKEIVEQVTMFFEQRDAQGKLLYPNAFANIEDILDLVQTGETLEDAYNLVMTGNKNKDKNPNIATPIVIQKLDKDTALIAYGYHQYEKWYYVKSNILKNYADGDEIIGYNVEKIQGETYSYNDTEGILRTVSCGQLIKN
jgi:hypothetical protein